ncbi:hypothetical protein FHS18_005791 [Paenibacillus phyllosphaerae]|uniref:DUF4183 domain-containing protein n=1 Tax=Paenibacillus phyllosphaerae TaxID=274593 RepID=A0A7W5B3J6_9BACL|nr:DUF4183 domain-containing protein [Paenibacillus phyllosphaerae]MBB3113678.1 hypothetical protein [Paenibacillus phyllosphaerae]
MPPSLIKLFVAASATAPVATGGTIDTAVTPVVTRFVAVMDPGMITGGATVIPAASFANDNGDPITDLPAPPTEGYYNVYVNAVLQEANLSTLTQTALTLDTVAIPAGAPIILEVDDFSATTSTMTVPPTISTPTITITT